MGNEVDHKNSLPIAEDFHSLQGEGRWTGTPMHFIRLAGCSVGDPRPDRTDPNYVQKDFPILKTGNPAWLCHTHDNRAFWCDTDFHLDHWSTHDDLLDATWEKHVCLTGGEPLMHGVKIEDFYEQCAERDIMLHVETSGTIQCKLPKDTCWISVSPKLNALDEMIDQADEIKLLVDEHFDLGKIPFSIRDHDQVFVQPINDELMVSKPNFDRCMSVLRLMPHWHLSIQTHKLLGLR